MRPIKVAQDAFKALWSHKILWLFGFFVAAGGGGGGGGARAKNFSSAAASTHAGLPGWFWPVLAVGVVFAIGALVMHLLSEGALIDGARRSRQGETVTARDGFRAGLASFGRVLGIKVVVGGLIAVPLLVMLTPAVLAALHIIPGLGALAVIPLAIVGVPLMLTVYFVGVYALRIAVLDGLGVMASLRAGKKHLSGRVLDSVKLLVVTVVGQIGGSIAALAVIVPIALVGGAVYLLAGLVPAAIVAGVLLIPAASALVGAMGAFRSLVWTLGFLDGRSEETA